MKLIEATLPKKSMIRPKTNIQYYLEEFLNSDMTCAECEFSEGEYSSPRVASTVLANAIKRYNYSCRVRYRNNRVYLIKPALIER